MYATSDPEIQPPWMNYSPKLKSSAISYQTQFWLWNHAVRELNHENGTEPQPVQLDWRAQPRGPTTHHLCHHGHLLNPRNATKPLKRRKEAREERTGPKSQPRPQQHRGKRPRADHRAPRTDLGAQWKFKVKSGIVKRGNGRIRSKCDEVTRLWRCRCRARHRLGVVRGDPLLLRGAFGNVSSLSLWEILSIGEIQEEGVGRWPDEGTVFPFMLMGPVECAVAPCEVVTTCHLNYPI